MTSSISALMASFSLMPTTSDMALAQSQISPKPELIRDRFQKPLSPSEQKPVLSTPSIPISESTPTDSSAQISVSRIEINGSTVLNPIEIQTITQQYAGKSVTVEELQTVANAITQIYLDRGYLTSRAILSQLFKIS